MKTAQELIELVHSEECDTSQIPPIVLVVDDHDDTLELYDSLLSASGCWVARAASGLEALEYAQDLRPDAIVTDIGLGGEMDGTDLIRELHADHALREVPVLVVTGREPRDLPSLAGLDISALLLKPVTPETLVTRVKTVLEASVSPNGSAPETASRVSESPSADAGPAPTVRNPKPHKKRRLCPSCGIHLSWIETRRYLSTVYDYYRECTHGCGLFCFNRHSQDFEVLVQGDTVQS